MFCIRAKEGNITEYEKGHSYRVVSKKSQKAFVLPDATFDESCKEKSTGLGDGQKFMEFNLETRDGNVTIEGESDEHSAHDS